MDIPHMKPAGIVQMVLVLEIIAQMGVLPVEGQGFVMEELAGVIGIVLADQTPIFVSLVILRHLGATHNFSHPLSDKL